MDREAGFLRDQGGMALLVTHPDYLLDDERLGTYERFLEAEASDDSVWRALPGEVASWWRSRAQSRLERVATGWQLVGPAESDGVVRVGAPPLAPASVDGAVLTPKG